MCGGGGYPRGGFGGLDFIAKSVEAAEPHLLYQLLLLRCVEGEAPE
jgi:hypothetical protein